MDVLQRTHFDVPEQFDAQVKRSNLIDSSLERNQFRSILFSKKKEHLVCSSAYFHLLFIFPSTSFMSLWSLQNLFNNVLCKIILLKFYMKSYIVHYKVFRMWTKLICKILRMHTFFETFDLKYFINERKLIECTFYIETTTFYTELLIHVRNGLTF